MAKNIEAKIVDMQFQNKQFEQGIATSTKSLAAFNQQLASMDQTTAMVGVAKNIEQISKHFTVMGQVGFAVLQKLTWSALEFGKSLIFPPAALRGFGEYELTLNSIKTIMAGTGESVERVTEKLQELNKYSDETIYSFSDMTNNIGKFTNTGTSLDDSVRALMGIANAAALSGASTNDAARAMYNFGQAMSLGYVQRIDWKSIENANMATVEFKNQLADVALELGTIKKNTDGTYNAAGKNYTLMQLFADGLKEQWLTSKVLIKTLNNYSDTTTDIGKRATAAAKQIETFTKMMDTFRESLQSAWAESMQLIFGNLEEARELWTTLAGVLDKFAGVAAKNRNELLKLWKASGGRDAFIEGISNAIIALYNVMKPIKDAWATIFPTQSGSRVVDLLKGFSKLTNEMIISGETASRLNLFFQNLFGILKVGKNVLGTFAKIFIDTFGRFLPVALHGFNTLANIVKYFFQLLSPYLVTAFSSAMNNLGGVLDYVASKLNQFIDWINTLFKTFQIMVSQSGAINAFSTAIGLLFSSITKIPGSILSGLSSAIKSISGLSLEFPQLGKMASGSMGLVGGLVDSFSKRLGNLKEAFTTTMKSVDPFDKTIEHTKETLAQKNESTGIFSGLLGAIGNLNPFKATVAYADELTVGMKSVEQSLVVVEKTTESIGQKIAKIGTYVLESIKGFIGNLSEMTGAEIFFTALKGILITGFAGLSIVILKSVGSLFVSVVGGLASIFTSIGGIMRHSVGVVKQTKFAMRELGEAFSRFGRDGIGTVIKSIALALGAFTISMIALALIPYDKIVVGATVVGIFIAALTAASFVLSKLSSTKGIAAMFIGAAGAILILTSAIRTFGNMKPEELVSGLMAVGAAMLVLIGPLVLLSKTMQGPGFVGVAGSILALVLGLKLLTGSIKALGKLNPAVLATGLIGVAAGLLALVAPLILLSNMDMSRLTGIGMTIIATALAMRVLVAAIKSLSKVQKLTKTMLVFVGIMGTLSLALLGLAQLGQKYNLKTITKSLRSIAGAMSLLAFSMLPLIAVPWSSILKGLTLLAGAMVGLVGVGAIFDRFPGFAKGALMFSKALHLLGKGVLALGLGIGVLSISLVLLGTAGVVGLTGLTAFMTAISYLAPSLAPALPVLGAMSVSLAALGVGILALGAGFTLLSDRGVIGIAILGGVVTAMVAFADDVAKLAPAMTSVTISIGLMAAAFLVLNAMIKRLEFMTTVKLSLIAGAFSLFTRSLGDNIDGSLAAAAALAVLSGGLYLLSTALGSTTIAGFGLVIGISAIILAITALTVAFAMLIEAMNGIEPKKIGEAFYEIGRNVIVGIIQGILDGAGLVVEAALTMVGNACEAVMDFLGIHSPSRVFYYFGAQSALGQANGMSENADIVTKGAISMVSPSIAELENRSQLYKGIGEDSALKYADGLTGPDSKKAIKFAAEKLSNIVVDEQKRAIGREGNLSITVEGNYVSEATDELVDNLTTAERAITRTSETYMKNITDQNEATEDALSKTETMWDKIARIIEEKTGKIGESTDTIKEKFGEIANLDPKKIYESVKAGDFSLFGDIGKELEESLGTTGLGASEALKKVREILGLDDLADMGQSGGRDAANGLADGMTQDKNKVKTAAKDLLSGLDAAVMDLNKKWTALTLSGYLNDRANINLVNMHTAALATYATQAQQTESAVNNLSEAEQAMRKLEQEYSLINRRDTNARRDNREERARLSRDISLYKKQMAEYNSAITQMTLRQTALDKTERQARFNRAYDELYSEYLVKGKLVQKEIEYSLDGGKTFQKRLSDSMTLPDDVLTELKARILEDSNAIIQHKKNVWAKELVEEKEARAAQQKEQEKMAKEATTGTNIDEAIDNVEKVPETVSTVVDEIGKQSAAAAETANKQVAETLDKTNATIETKTEESKTALSKPFETFLDTIQTYKPQVELNMNQLIDIMLGVSNARIEEFKAAAIALMDAFKQGMLGEELNIISTTLTGLLSSAHTETLVFASSFYEIGTSITQGITKGIISGEATVIQAAINMATRAIQAARRALGINSPSKVFEEMGPFCAEGLANGITSRSAINTLQNGSKMMAIALTSGFQNSIDQNTNGFTSGIEKAMELLSRTNAITDPIIRPVIDSTEIDNFERRMANGYEPGMAYLKSGEFAGNAADGFNHNTMVSNTPIPQTTQTPVQPNLTVNLTNTVRNDSDIQKITKEMNAVIRRQGYALGNVL